MSAASHRGRRAPKPRVLNLRFATSAVPIPLAATPEARLAAAREDMQQADLLLHEIAIALRQLADEAQGKGVTLDLRAISFELLNLPQDASFATVEISALGVEWA